MQNVSHYPASAPSHAAPSPVSAAAATVADATKCRVLVIDDCPDTIRLLKAYLNDPKIQLTIARNGIEGLAAFRDGVFDLVLMDMEMPEMNGYAATISIRNWEADRHLHRTPIAALTAATDFGASNRILLAGCTLHLTKPIMRETLLQIVRPVQSGQINGPDRERSPLGTATVMSAGGRYSLPANVRLLTRAVRPGTVFQPYERRLQSTQAALHAVVFPQPLPAAESAQTADKNL